MLSIRNKNKEFINLDSYIIFNISPKFEELVNSKKEINLETTDNVLRIIYGIYISKLLNVKYDHEGVHIDDCQEINFLEKYKIFDNDIILLFIHNFASILFNFTIIDLKGDYCFLHGHDHFKINEKELKSQLIYKFLKLDLPNKHLKPLILHFKDNFDYMKYIYQIPELQDICFEIFDFRTLGKHIHHLKDVTISYTNKRNLRNKVWNKHADQVIKAIYRRNVYFRDNNGYYINNDYFGFLGIDQIFYYRNNNFDLDYCRNYKEEIDISKKEYSSDDSSSEEEETYYSPSPLHGLYTRSIEIESVEIIENMIIVKYNYTYAKTLKIDNPVHLKSTIVFRCK